MAKTGTASTIRAPEGSFAAVIAEARERAGVTRADMARLLNIAPSAITMLESGDRSGYGLREETIRRYADALGLDVRLEFVARRPSRRR